MNGARGASSNRIRSPAVAEPRSTPLRAGLRPHDHARWRRRFSMRRGRSGGGRSALSLNTAERTAFTFGHEEPRLGPVNAMGANANEWHGAPIAAADEAKTGDLGEESNKEWRPMPLVPFGLLPKTPSAALQKLGGCPTRLRLRALRWAFSAVQRVRAHSVTRP